ncbi:MAG: pyridoxal-dependent decarboxylase, exosortase A system-associated, partial [Anaerolineae bacterium]|nr:pyridoxal-dependent decarboxylase, exosortase A system-associated [Anaerolineae bacterium]
MNIASHALTSSLAHFKRENGELLVGGKPISQIARENSTPFYVYDREVVRWRHTTLRRALPEDIEIHYAMKANPNESVLRELASLYNGFDIASAGEMKMAMAAGVSPQVMSFAGPGKTPQELGFAIDNGIGSISVESEHEIDHVEALAVERGKIASILIRINPEFELGHSGMKMGGGPKQFGIDSELVPKVISSLRTKTHIAFKGIHIFAGSQNLHADAILFAFEGILAYSLQLTKLLDSPLSVVNLGGGFGIPYFTGDRDLDLETLGMGLRGLLSRFRPRMSSTVFRIELGRFIVGEAGIYVSRVLYRKMSRGQVFLVTDGGMHHHLAASGNFGQSLVRRPYPITVLNKL